ncbi:MAG: hypothetical protein IPK82_18205 [Polyangiaceae bacterium]|nr:hypothetical protein [Polyangiaceae bacterium]
MQIDRARFLFLTASLAGGGCSSNPPNEAATPPVPTETGTEVVVPETTEPGTTSGESTSSETTASPESTTTSAPQQPPQGVCDNDTGTVPACALSAPPGPHCEGLTEARATCKGFKNAFRAAIGAKAVSCLNATSGTQAVCDYTSLERCGAEAVRSACIQPSTFNACSQVVGQCSGFQWNKLTMNDCQAMLSAVKDGKRQSLITCMTEGCSIDSCTWSIR